MAEAFYVGPPATTGRDIERQETGEATLQSGVSRDGVDARVSEIAASYATKEYVDTQDSQFAAATYFAAGDSALIPNEALGVPGGVASLNASARIPTNQVPVLGFGILRGPYGHKTVVPGITTVTPKKIADVFTGLTNVTGMLLAFMQVLVQSTGGRPVIEIRAGNNTQTTYASQTLIAAGVGREYYNAFQPVTVLPAPHTTGMAPGTPWAANTNLLVQAWMYDDGGGEVEIEATGIYTSAFFFAKTQV